MTVRDARVIYSAASTLPDPPTSWAQWPAAGEIPFWLELWANAAVDGSVLEMVAGVFEAVTISDDDVDTVDFANNELDLTSHAYADLDGPVQLTTTDTLPTGIELLTDFWIRVVGVNSIQLYPTLQDAIDGTNVVAFSDVGVGTHTIEDTASTERARWHSLGKLGDANDGDVDLTATKGYAKRFVTLPAAELYSVIGTVDAAITAQIRMV